MKKLFAVLAMVAILSAPVFAADDCSIKVFKKEVAGKTFYLVTTGSEESCPYFFPEEFSDYSDAKSRVYWWKWVMDESAKLDAEKKAKESAPWELLEVVK